jgi:hypothetical protein
MQPLRVLAIAAAAAVVFNSSAPALLAADGQEGRRGGPPPPVSLIASALDTSGDGIISSAEIAAAPAALRRLDRNGDGILDASEVRPSSPQEPTISDELTQTLMGFDADKNGRLTRAEVPERFQGLFERADANKDGQLSPEEIRQSAAQQDQSSPATRGGREGRGGRGAFVLPDPLQTALDADHNGQLSSVEIDNAPKALLTLDLNMDGQLTVDETRPVFGRGRGGR